MPDESNDHMSTVDVNVAEARKWLHDTTYVHQVSVRDAHRHALNLDIKLEQVQAELDALKTRILVENAISRLEGTGAPAEEIAAVRALL